MFKSAATATSFYTHSVANSARFTGSGTMSRTAGTPTNIDRFTISCWVKGHKLGTLTNFVFGYEDNLNYQKLAFNSSDKLELHEQRGSGDSNGLRTDDQVFRDPAAWMHVVWVYDSGNATEADREIFYVNGTRLSNVEGWDGGYPTQNRDSVFNKSGATQHIGSASSYYGNYFQGYMAEVVFCDGQAYDGSDFGETKNGVWIPKDVSGLTFGNNGFYLNFASASDMGNDVSGNNNDFSESNVDTHDQLTDTPTNNFPTYNPLNKGSYTDLSEGNLRADSNTGSDASYPSGTVGFPSSGKWYYEQLIGNLTNSYPTTFLVAYGAEEPDTANRGMFWAMRYRSDTGTAAQSSGEAIAPFGTITVDNTSVASLATGDIVSWYIDMDNKKAWIAKNGSIPNSGDPANGTNPQFSWTENPVNGFTFGSQEYQTSFTTFNGGQDGTFAGEKTAQGNSDGNSHGNFYYSVPTGFLALCTANIPMTAAIDPAETDDDHPSKLVKSLRYTGNDGTQTIAMGFKPDWLMLNMLGSTGGGYPPQVWDTTRGDDYYLYPSGNANSVTSGSDYVEFVSTGFKLDNNWDGINHSGETYGAIGIRANGGTTSSNSNGSITSTVQVDPSGHFSIGTYTGESASKTVGHGLSSAPDCIVVKATSGTVRNWAMYNRNRGATKAMYWNNSNAEDTSTVAWGNTHATSTVFSIGDSSETGKSQDYIFYAFANCEGYIRAGTYEGNATADGPFVYLGFQPVWLLIRYIGTGESWINNTNTSLSYNGDRRNYRFGSNAESSGSTYAIDLLSNGFKLRTTWEGYNGNGYVITYLAIGQPFKYGTAV